MARATKDPRVDNKLLREAFRESGLSWAEVARRMDLSYARADNIRKAMGLTPDTRPGGKKYYRKTMRESDAVAVARALHKLPYELGF
jgi:CRISPR/Cas system-associated protein Csm6